MRTATIRTRGDDVTRVRQLTEDWQLGFVGVALRDLDTLGDGAVRQRSMLLGATLTHRRGARRVKRASRRAVALFSR